MCPLFSTPTSPSLLYFSPHCFLPSDILHIYLVFPYQFCSRSRKDFVQFPYIYTHDSVWYIIQFSSIFQSCPTLCDPMNHSMPGLPVHHQLPEFTQTHVHRVGDAIQPSHPLLSPSPPAPNPSQHQGLFQ